MERREKRVNQSVHTGLWDIDVERSDLIAFYVEDRIQRFRRDLWHQGHVLERATDATALRIPETSSSPALCRNGDPEAESEGWRISVWNPRRRTTLISARQSHSKRNSPPGSNV
jgi:hypothetical protein